MGVFVLWMFPLLSSHLYPLLYHSISLVRLLVPVVEQWRLTYSSLLSYSIRLLYQVYTVIVSLRSISIDAYGSVMSDLLLFIWPAFLCQGVCDDTVWGNLLPLTVCSCRETAPREAERE